MGECDTVQRYATVVTDDTTTTIRIRQTGQNAGFTATGCPGYKRRIRRLWVLRYSVKIFDHWVSSRFVRFAGTFNRYDTAERDNRTLQRASVCR